jgi:hypothetical protein
MANGTNYTLYYNVLNYLKKVMKNHPSINYVTQGDVFSIDTKEFPQYPLANVIITDATFDGKSTDYGVQIVVADKTKLKGNESSGSNNTQTIEFEGVDDTVDIHANTLAIINDILSYTDRKEEGFEVNGTVSCTAFKERFDNGLAGWSADFTLRVHNDRDFCLFDLNPDDDVSAYKLENCDTSEPLFVTFKNAIPDGSGSIRFNDTCYSISGSVSVETEQMDYFNIDGFFTTDCEECTSCVEWRASGFLGNPLVTWTDCNGVEQSELISEYGNSFCSRTQPESGAVAEWITGSNCS